LPDKQLHFAQDGCSFTVGDLQLQPYAVPHDAHEPLQLCCSDGRGRLGMLTDAGSITDSMLNRLGGCDVLLLEFNHDLELLQHSSYPVHLKKRIQGPRGHLSNESAAQALAVLAHADLQHVVAAHLSERNNTPSLVRLALQAGPSAASWTTSIADARLGTDWLQLN
jgi:phosphoribosyl 1,2-cyclic phosphodiesterase